METPQGQCIHSQWDSFEGDGDEYDQGIMYECIYVFLSRFGHLIVILYR